ncbi:MAG: ATP-binding protein, partial [Deltaproteobacteria bacterium]|nr:ATP-binding protein [Deltaproteobacteria bacterium]
GSGKSAILALLGLRLIDKGVPVLAIKADMLPRSIKDLEDLQVHLRLPLPVIQCLTIVSRSEPVVLIVDQLDAISEVVDRDSERLNLLLDFILRASKIDGLHVVSSCRWFEYQHDIRLTTIEAEKVSLEPPSWEDVKKVLKEAGFPKEHWSDELRKLLSVPLHLKILLDIKSRDPDAKVPLTLQGLLENIWQQRVIVGETVSEKLTFLDILCKRMSEDEELWVPRSVADDYASAFNELQQGNILQLDPSGLKIGFVHQTYFDFARARAFARDREKLSEYVIQRQDGLFIRPVLLTTLDYLRGTSPAIYEKEVKSLWDNQGLRPHLRSLLIDYLGNVEKPNDTEISCLLPMLKEKEQGYRVLLAMAGSPGWFSIIKDAYLPTFMSQGPEFAHFCIPILSRAFSFAKAEVLKIVKEIWIPDARYDEYVLMLFTYLGDWDEASVKIICEIAKRHESHWIPHIADLVSQSKPDLAPKIVRADFDRRLQEAIRKEAEAVPPQPPPSDASNEEKMIYHLETRKGKEIELLLRQDKGWHELSQIAVGAPKAFLDCLWPWFKLVVERIVHEPHPFVTSYQEDYSLGTLGDRTEGVPDQPISALHDAVVALSEKEPEQFLTFFRQNIDSPYMTIHRLLCTGLLKLAASYPHVILDYLTSDPRRLAVGDSFDCHKASRRLIAAVVPHLDEKGRHKLENAVVNWNRYYRENPAWSTEDRYKRRKWSRQHRLRLLRAFPEEYLSEETRALRDKEERALPGVPDWDSRIGGVGEVRSPMSHEQMAKAKDEHILNLFEVLDDSTEWDHPKRRWEFIGGSIQASREFAKLAEEDPERVARLLLHFEPGKQERPVAMAINGLAKSSFPSKKLFQLIEALVTKGHSSFEFRRDVARALHEKAKKDRGLPDTMVRLLEQWLTEDPYPSLEERSHEREEEETRQSILWGYGFTFSLPGGRDVYIEAIANGYLLRDPPAYAAFSEIIESRLILEDHPDIWKVSLHSMSFLFNWDRAKATHYFDQVITRFKEVRESKLGVLEMGRVLHLLFEEETIERWLTLLRDSRTPFSQQAFGELVMLCVFYRPEDNWARGQIETCLNNKEAIGIHRGLAFAAANNWNLLSHQDLCAEVLTRLSESDDEIVQEAISQVFKYGEQVILNDNMKRIIEGILPYDQVLLKSADRLIEGIMDQTTTEPEIIGRVCNRVLDAGKTEIQNIGSRLALVAEAIVSIALT